MQKLTTTVELLQVGDYLKPVNDFWQILEIKKTKDIQNNVRYELTLMRQKDHRIRYEYASHGTEVDFYSKETW